MNESIPHSNESDSKDMMTKKGLKEMKVTTYTKQVTPSFSVAQS